MSKTILLASNALENQTTLREVLRSSGYRVLWAEDGEGVLERAIRYRPDLVIMDLMIPDALGVSVQLRTGPNSCFVPVLLIGSPADIESHGTVIRARGCTVVDKSTQPDALLGIVGALLELKARSDDQDSAESVLTTLARAVDSKDPYTEGHSDRIAKLVLPLARRAGLTDEGIRVLQRAALVHDIGKIAVPDAILLKQGPLTSDEMRIVRQHPVVGERICAPLKSMAPVLPIIRHHHEKMDGTGYPDGLHGTEIPLSARVMQVVDIYDALTTERPYRSAFSGDEALLMMQENVHRGWCDPDLFSQMRALILSGEVFANPVAPQSGRIGRGSH